MRITQAVYIVHKNQDLINLTPYLLADSIQESEITRREREITTLSGDLRRWRITKRGLSLAFRKMRMEKAQELTSILSGRITLEYDDSKYGRTTRDFYADNLSDTIAKVEGGNTWITGFTVNLEEV